MPEFKVCAARLELRVPDMRAAQLVRANQDDGCGVPAVPVLLHTRS